MNPNLFVYGSLMSMAGHPMGERLAREGKLLGKASMQGRLYRISWYPGAVEGGAPDERVHGEAFALDDPARAFAWLDTYEGIVPGTPGEYERAERSVRLADGADIAAWAYLYRGHVAGLQQVLDGRWVPQAR